MEVTPNNPGRFTLCHESWTAAVVRNAGIAVGVGSIIALARLHHWPAMMMDWRRWGALILFVAWISFGGHFVELFYLNGLRPRIAGWSDRALVLVRLGVWFVGGTLLVMAACVSSSLFMAGEFPTTSSLTRAMRWGGLGFVGIELVVHLLLQLRGKSSFWNGRG